MVTKTLDEIVMEADVRERIRPLFEQATASGNVSFEHDFQWQAYCDLLYAVAKFQEECLRIHKNPKNRKLSVVFGEKSGDYTSAYHSWKNDGPEKTIDSFLKKVGELLSVVLRVKVKKMRVYDEERGSILRALYYNLEGAYEKTDEKNDIALFYDCAFFERRAERVIALLNQDYQRVFTYFENAFWNLLDTPVDITDDLTHLPELTKEEQRDLRTFVEYNQTKFKDPKDEDGAIVRVMKLLHREEYQERRDVERIPEAMECSLILIFGYRVITRIGQGSGRITYKAWDETDECYVAIKVEKDDMKQTSVQREEQVKQYGKNGLEKAEGKNARKLTHLNIARYFGRGKAYVKTMEDIGNYVRNNQRDERAYVIEEYVEGVTLEKFISLIIEEDKAWMRGSIETIVQQVLQGVAYMHEQRYMHRDLKPDNILVPNEYLLEARFFGIDAQVKITDFELVGKIRDGEKRVHGSRAYAAPEALESGEMTLASDVFSLGIIMYETFTQKHPFVFQETDKDDKEKIATNILKEYNYPGIHTQIASSAEIPEDYKPIIQHCLQYDPHERFQNAGEIIGQIQKTRKDREKTAKREVKT